MDIRHAKPDDTERLAQIEALSYPEQEGASKESIGRRILAFPDCFWILEDNEGNIVSFINGMITDSTDLADEMYDNPQMHNPNGKWQMLFSVVTTPEHRQKGYASILLRQMISDSRTRGLSGVVLTCKEKLVGFYSAFGFINEGVSESVHGNVTWYQMRLTF